MYYQNISCCIDLFKTMRVMPQGNAVHASRSWTIHNVLLHLPSLPTDGTAARTPNLLSLPRDSEESEANWHKLGNVLFSDALSEPEAD